MSEPGNDPTCEMNRRNCLGATGAALLGATGLSALSNMALAANPAESEMTKYFMDTAWFGTGNYRVSPVR